MRFLLQTAFTLSVLASIACTNTPRNDLAQPREFSLQARTFSAFRLIDTRATTSVTIHPYLQSDGPDYSSGFKLHFYGSAREYFYAMTASSDECINYYQFREIYSTPEGRYFDYFDDQTSSSQPHKIVIHFKGKSDGLYQYLIDVNGNARRVSLEFKIRLAKIGADFPTKITINNLQLNDNLK